MVINIPPNPPLILPPNLVHDRQVKPVEPVSDREIPVPHQVNLQERRRTRRERRGNASQRMKAFDLRSGRDRRKNSRDQPSIETDA